MAPPLGLDMSEDAGAGASAASGARQKTAGGFAALLLSAIVVPCVGGLLAALLIAFALGQSDGASQAGTLAQVAPSEIAQASLTLDLRTAQQVVTDAKSCKAPMAYVTIAKESGARGGVIRIQSGSYVSPPFQVTDAPSRVAIPFPAPYPSGAGAISILGSASGLAVSLTPTWRVDTLNGSAQRNVVWTPGKAC
jgi:hypothetical protein